MCQRVPGRGLRIDIRHVHETRNATGRSRSRFRRKVGFVRKTRLPKMNLIVDHSGHQVSTIRIDNCYAIASRYLRIDFFDSLAVNEHVDFANLIRRALLMSSFFNSSFPGHWRQYAREVS
jgi:hypothetical protein